MKNLIINELKIANINIEGNIVSRIEDAIHFVKENGIEWFNENSTFGIKLKNIVLKFI
jgi:hypothetical protein